jgi:hypothetical protein
MSSSLFSSFQENIKYESSFFADTCTRRVPIFIYVGQIMSKAIKKIVEEARDNAYTELDLADREIKSLNSVPILRKL